MISLIMYNSLILSCLKMILFFLIPFFWFFFFLILFFLILFFLILSFLNLVNTDTGVISVICVIFVKKTWTFCNFSLFTSLCASCLFYFKHWQIVNYQERDVHSTWADNHQNTFILFFASFSLKINICKTKILIFMCNTFPFIAT